MLGFNRGDKDENNNINEKATDRLAYMRASVPAWERSGISNTRSRSYASLMERFNGWVYASAMINARAIASQTLKLYTIKPKNGAKAITATKSVSNQKQMHLRGELESKPSSFVQRKAIQGDIIEVLDHPVLELLDNPSPEMDGYTLTIQRMLNLQLTGNAYLHPIISETLGVPIELWNMQSDLVTIIPDGTMDLVEGYVYGKLPTTTDFRRDEVLHEKQPNPSDPFYGVGWVEKAITAVDLLASMDKYEQDVLDNQARPDWMVMVKDHLTDSQYQRLMQQIDRELGGRKSGSRPFIFENGVSASPMNFSPQDLAFDSGEMRKIEVISAISGVPVTMLKANDPNLASSREGSMNHLRNTVIPYLTLDEGFLNRQLLPMFGQYAENLFVAYDDPITQDRQIQASIDASDISAGIRTRNEVRLERGLPPVDGGDELMIAMGQMPIDTAIEQARNPAQVFGAFSASPAEIKNEAEDEEILQLPALPEVEEVEEDHDKCCDSPAFEVSQKMLFDSSRSLAGAKRVTVDRLNEVYEAMLSGNAGAIEQFERGLTEWMELRIGRLVDSGLLIDTMFDADSQQEIERLSSEFISSVSMQGGQQALDELGVEVEWNFLDPSIDRFLKDYTSELAGSILEGTKRDVEARIDRGIRDGLSTDDIARNILDLTQEGADGVPTLNRARMIARTEVATIHEQARLQAWEESGVVKAKQWQVSAGACPFCQELGRMRPDPIPLSEAFISGGKPISAGGKTMRTYKAIKTAPLHPNCRCGTIEILTDEDVTIDERKL